MEAFPRTMGVDAARRRDRAGSTAGALDAEGGNAPLARRAVHPRPQPLASAPVQTRPSQLAQAVAAARVHPHAAKIAEVAAEVAARMADARARHATAADIEQIAQKVPLDRADAESEFGNVLAILERGAEDSAERAIVAAFVAAGVMRELEKVPGEAAERRWADRLCFLAAHAGFDPLAACPDGVLPTVLRPLYRAIAEHARHIDAGKVPSADRAELLVAAASLADAVELLGAADELASVVSRLAADMTDATAARIITARAADAPATVVQSSPAGAFIRGHLAPLPRGTALTFLYAITGWLILRSLFLLIARYVLSLKRDAKIGLTQQGIEVDAKVAILGRELRDLSAHYPANGLASITRETRFPSLHVYVGLAALLCGTYAGVTALAWGVPSSSPRLIGYGILALLGGVVLDLLITSIVPGGRGRCRIVIVPKRGRRLCVAGVDAHAADRLLADFARKTD